ncbi:hypothetical protein B0H11DRAFT_2201984 [Mycena galericulata]|nr:hypothetical protein B0H11DRAFT_2201984 [Mycena galericulata]
MSSSQLLHVGSMEGGAGGAGGSATAGSGGPGGTGEGPQLSARQANNYYITNIGTFLDPLCAGYMVPQHEMRVVDETLNGRGEGSRTRCVGCNSVQPLILPTSPSTFFPTPSSLEMDCQRTESRSDAQRSSTTDFGRARATETVPDNATPAGAGETIDLVSPAPSAQTAIKVVSPTDDEGMDETTAAQRCAAKSKARARTPVSIPPPALSPTLLMDESALLSLIGFDEIEPLADANLGGFFENGARPDPCYTTQGASTSRRPEGSSWSPPMCPRLDPVVPARPSRVYITADRNPPRVYYTPTDTLPQSTVDPDIILDNVDPACITLWANAPHTLLAFVAGGSTDPVAEALAGADLVSKALNLPPGTVRMGAANSANPRLPAPNAFGITGVPPDLGVELVRRGVLCTPRITLFIFPLNSPRSGFLGIVEGLTFENTASGAKEAANAITGALSTNTDFVRLVMSHRDALPANFSSHQEVLAAVLGSVSVVPLELACSLRVVWRVYMRVTTKSADGYNAIRRAFRQAVFVTAFNNTGRVREDMSCRICRAIDHPTPLCPFPDAPGWMGPTPTSLPPPAPADEPGTWCSQGTRRTRLLIDKRTGDIYLLTEY